MQPVDIIIPVYGALDSVRECISSVEASELPSTTRVMIYDDATNDVELSSYLRAVATQHPGRFYVRTNHENKGFAATVNAAVNLYTSHDIIILNSDACVPRTWVEKLQQCAYKSMDVGTVTPLTNNGTLASFPVLGREQSLPLGFKYQDVDTALGIANRDVVLEIPTAVGFCTYIKRTCWDAIGGFDAEAFPAGYGEEVDFSLKAGKRGFKHLLCLYLFVYHVGSKSFGDKRETLSKRATAILYKRYPIYQKTLNCFFSNDKGRPYRIQGLLELLRRSSRAKIISVLHDLGGGTEEYVLDLARYTSKEAFYAILRPRGRDFIELSLDPFNRDARLTFRIPQQLPTLKKVIEYLQPDAWHINHLLGIHQQVQSLILNYGLPIDITCHDYYFINGCPTSPNCRDVGGDGVAVKFVCNGRTAQAGGNQRQFIEVARRVIIPSNAAASFYRKAYPWLNPVVAAHPDQERSHPYSDVTIPRHRAGGPWRVAVIGRLNREKGLDVLEKCARLASKDGIPLEFHYFGVANKRLNKHIKQHGSYANNDLLCQLGTAGIHFIWLPFQWPETYSFVLSRVLETGYPLVASDLGAICERVEGRPGTWLFPAESSTTHWLRSLVAVSKELGELSRVEQPSSLLWPQTRLSEKFYCDKFLLPKSKNWCPGDVKLTNDEIAKVAYLTLNPLQNFEKFLAHSSLMLLTWLKTTTGFEKLSRFIPYDLQKRIKRHLTRSSTI